jgi:TolA-binding protein
MSLRLLLLVLVICAVNAHGQTATVTPRQETVDETAGPISTMKDDILALRREVEAQKLLIETLQEQIKSLESEIYILKSKSMKLPEDEGL